VAQAIVVSGSFNSHPRLWSRECLLRSAAMCRGNEADAPLESQAQTSDLAGDVTPPAAKRLRMSSAGEATPLAKPHRQRDHIAGEVMLPPVKLELKPRAILGCLCIASDNVMQEEGPAFVSCLQGVELRIQKIRFDSDQICASTFQRAAGDITEAALQFMPASACSVLGISCTSMSFTLGPGVFDKQLHLASLGAKTTDMARAQVAALAALGVKRIALVTPYMEAVAASNVRMLESSGLEVVSSATMGLDRDELTTAVTRPCIADWAAAVDCEEAEAVVIGCSALRACKVGFIDDLEARLGKPVVTSTQAFLWSMLRTAGISDQVAGFGRLLVKC